MAHLYPRKDGKLVTIHSYSAGNDFKSCKRLYQLKKIEGWKEKEQKAAFKFGDCIEQSIRFFHESGLRAGSAGEEFTRLWLKHQDNKELVYTDKEASWEAMHQMGVEMLALYEIRLPSLPIYRPQFQVKYQKEVFPGSELAGIDFVAYVDMEVRRPESELLLLDIKTSSQELDESIPNLLALDGQLLSYGWVSGIRQVGFLWFTKVKIGPCKKGDVVTLLKQSSSFKEGSVVRIIQTDETETVYFLPEEYYQKYVEEENKIEGKGAKKAKEELILNYMKYGSHIGRKDVTKQKLQFVTAQLNPDDVKEMGEAIGQEISDIVDARERDFFPKQPMIRGLIRKCQMCPFLGICLGNKQLRDERVVRTNSDWLDEMEDE